MSIRCDSYRELHQWLDDRRFYLNDEQCRRINAALDRLEALMREADEIVIGETRFETHLHLNDSYLN